MAGTAAREKKEQFLGVLMDLAKRILALDIPERHFVHAENMICCTEEEYSIAFHEAAKQLTDLLDSGYTLEQGVIALANKIPAVEDLKTELKWKEDSESCVSREQLYEHAEKVMEIAKDTDIEGPDVRLARRTLNKKLSTTDWKLAALRYCDIEIRTVLNVDNLSEFLEDETRCEMEFTEMRKHLEMVRIEDKRFVMQQPRLPPWQDVAIWKEVNMGRGGYTVFFPIPVVNLQTHAQLAAGTEDQDRNDAEWPPLKKPAHMKMPLQDKGKERIKDPTPNAWTDRARKKTFMNSGIARSKLNYKPPDSAENDCLIDITRAYTTKEVWGHALLGQYVGRHPGHSAIISMMKQWKPKAKYKEEQGWMIFNFDSEEDQEEVLMGGPYLIHGRPLILKHVPDKFAFTNKDYATVPLWIRIHGLGTRFWTEEYLGNIASYVGKPLYLDPVTADRKRHSYARVLVEINLSNKVVRKVPLRFSDGDHLECPIQIENEPKFCQHCCAFGHLDSECKFLSKAAIVSGGNMKDSAGCSMAQPAERKMAVAVGKKSATAAATESKDAESKTAEDAENSTKRSMAAATLKNAEKERTQQCPSHKMTADDDGNNEVNEGMDRPLTAAEKEQFERPKERAIESKKDKSLVALADAGTLEHTTPLKMDRNSAAPPPFAAMVHQQHVDGTRARDRI